MNERLHFHFSLSCIGEGNGNPLQCSCLENPRDGGAPWAAVYGVAQSRTRLKWLSSSSSSCVTNYHKFSSLKPHPLVIAVFMGQESSARLQLRCWPGLESHLRLDWKDPFPRLCSRLQHSFLHVLLDWRPPSIPCCGPLHTAVHNFRSLSDFWEIPEIAREWYMNMWI